MFEDVDAPVELASRTHALDIVPDPEPVQRADVWSRGFRGARCPSMSPVAVPSLQHRSAEELDIRRVKRGKGFSYHVA